MAVLWGSGLMLAYDCLRMFRMMIRQRKGIQAAEEAVFWLMAAGCLFGLLYRFNNGAVRNYIVCGMGTGIHGCSLDAGGIASDKTNSSNF